MTLEHQNLRGAAELRKLNAEIAKLEVETSKLLRERRLYPLVIATGLMGAMAALVGLSARFLIGE